MNSLATHYVIPGVLEKDWSEIEKKLEVLKTFCDKVHIDVIDGKFSDNTTFLDPAPFAKYKNDLFLEVHLMVEEPINYLKNFSNAGFKRFIGHVEKMGDQAEFVAEGQILGEVGLALDLDSSLDLIKVPFEDLDLIQTMSVKAGKSGQEFVGSSLEKIKELKLKTLQQVQGKLPIEVDGGINSETLKLAKDAGANFFVATSFIESSRSPKEAFQTLENLATS